MFRYQGLPIVDPANRNDLLMFVGNTDSKSGDALAYSVDDGQTWRIAPNVSRDTSQVVDASFAPSADQRTGDQLFEVTTVGGNGSTFSVQMAEITPGGTAITVDADEGRVTVDDSHGQWTRLPNGAQVYTLHSVKGGGDDPTQLQVGSPEGSK